MNHDFNDRSQFVDARGGQRDQTLRGLAIVTGVDVNAACLVTHETIEQRVDAFAVSSADSLQFAGRVNLPNLQICRRAAHTARRGGHVLPQDTRHRMRRIRRQKQDRLVCLLRQ